jgi:hypothetical protein
MFPARFGSRILQRETGRAQFSRKEPMSRPRGIGLLLLFFFFCMIIHLHGFATGTSSRTGPVWTCAEAECGGHCDGTDLGLDSRWLTLEFGLVARVRMIYFGSLVAFEVPD